MINANSWHSLTHDLMSRILTRDFEQGEIRSKFLIANHLIALRQFKQDKNTLYRIALICKIEFAFIDNNYSEILSILDQVSEDPNPPEYEEALIWIRAFLKQCENSTQLANLNQVKAWLELQEFDNYISKVSRFITYKSALNSYKNNDDELKDIYLQAILDECQEAEGMIYYFIAYGFRLNILELLVIDDIVQINYPYGDSSYRIILLRQGSIYYHVINIDQMEKFRLNVKTGIYESS